MQFLKIETIVHGCVGMVHNHAFNVNSIPSKKALVKEGKWL
jgi:hypothetical protein